MTNIPLQAKKTKNDARAQLMALIISASNVLKESLIYTSTQNWTGYLLMQSVFWKSLKVKQFGQNTGKMRILGPRKKPSILTFTIRIEHWKKNLIYSFVERSELYRLLYGPFSTVVKYERKNRNTIVVEKRPFFEGQIEVWPMIQL
jgi:hypothetical protein